MIYKESYMRRLKRFVLRGIIGLVVFVALLIALGAGFERWARWEAVREFPPPGRLVEVDGAPTHLHCSGSGTPTVVLESGTGSPSAVWTHVQPEIARFTRVCSYDRPGLGWSKQRGGPRGAVQTAEALHALLGAASERAPYVLVGHSLGGARNLIYARRFPTEVAGFVFVDATHPEWRDHLPPELSQDTETQWIPRRLVLSVLTEAGILRVVQSLLADAGQGEDRQRARAFGPQNLRGAMREGERSEEVLERARETGSLGDKPVIVLTADAMRLPEETPPEIRTQVRALRLEFQRELASRSTNSDHRIIAESGHSIQIDAPESVVTAVRDVVAALRQNRAVRSEAPLP